MFFSWGVMGYMPGRVPGAGLIRWGHQMGLTDRLQTWAWVLQEGGGEEKKEEEVVVKMRGGFSFSFSELPHCNLILKLRLQSVINLIIRMGLNRIYPTPRIALSDVRPLDRHCLTFSPHVTCTHTHLMCVCALHMLTHLIRQPSDTLTCQMDWGREGHKSQSHSLRVFS